MKIFKSLLIIILFLAGILIAPAILPAAQRTSQKVFWGDYFTENFALLTSANNTRRTDSNTEPVNMQQVADKVSAGVVSIFGVSSSKDDETVVTEKNSQTNSIFDSYLSRRQNPVSMNMNNLQTKIVAGSGFFISSSGYILTNKHVVSDGTAQFTVVLDDGSRKKALVVYRDAANDLAVIKIESTTIFQALPLGDSSKIKIGQQVAGIGNAFGQFADTVSAGNISGLRKIILEEDDSNPLPSRVLESSAQLYPGQSGGPLFDTNGHVIGIDVAIAEDEDHVSFSIPINDAKNIINQYSK